MMTALRTCLAALLLLSAAAAENLTDLRNIATGSTIPDEGYCDQPYVVITKDGNWLCLLTTGKGVEGQAGQHIVSTISTDKGRTWSMPVDIEPAGGPEASWVMPLKVPNGRVYALYTYNKENVRAIPLDNTGRTTPRVDTLGGYVFKYSDDNGHTWSKQRYEIPMRPYAIDRDNNFLGKVLFFWGVGKPIIDRQTAYFGWAKVGRWWFVSEGMIMRSDNVVKERDPAKVRWEMLPRGDHGLRAPKGAIAEETNLVTLSGGMLFAMYRTQDGYLCHAYSKDRGRTWTPPEYATYSPGGRRIKHPRAAGFVWKASNGKYLLWYHNNSGESSHAVEKFVYWNGRNPGWISGGIEKNGRIHWSEPEILLYDDDPAVRISYPDLIEDHGRYFITETQKTAARVHEIDARLLEGVWNQFTRREVTRDGLALELTGERAKSGAAFVMPRLPNPAERRGFTIEFWLRLKQLNPGQVILDTRDRAKRGLLVTTSDRVSLKLTLSDGKTQATWDSDPGTGPGTLKLDTWQHVVFIVDGGPRIISTVLDGVLNDGGYVRDYGFGRFDAGLGDVNGLVKTTLAPRLIGEIRCLRIFNRYLRTSEAVSNYRAGLP